MTSYAFVPWLLAEGWKRSIVFAVLAFAWSLTGPAVAWLSLRRVSVVPASGTPNAIEAVAATVTPPFFAIFGVALSFIGWLSFRTYVWFGLMVVVALLSRLAAPSKARQSATLRRIHQVAAVPLLLFLLAHVANHLMAIQSLDAHVRVQNTLRLAYRQPIVEALLLAAAITQVISGAALVWKARGFRFTPLRALQFISGAYLSMFFFSHLNAVFVFGRGMQDADTTFEWATGGRGGLLTSAGSAQLLPYYFLSVLALFFHLACAGRWTLVPIVGDGPARRTAWAIAVVGVVAAVGLLAPLTGFRVR